MIDCPECNGHLSPMAKRCPHCGHPNAYCPRCHQMTAVRGFRFRWRLDDIDTQTVGYAILIFLLLMLGIVPGLLAIAYLANVPYCPDCKKLILERRPI